MDIREIRKILDMIRDNDLAEFEVEDQGFRLKVRRRIGAEPAVALTPASASATAATPAAAAVPPAAVAAPAPEAEEERWHTITAPIVGTFYRSPAPDAEPFVTVGQEVDENTVVCIIEAMKVMNEIKAECRGIVRKVLVENATAVQYGQALFKIEPL
ncbi:MAG: acetyl-CoA carboxylase biotin carboxyl carrier protein [Kiritimatiellae bacterium]|nr:acetyl-CoA carboxylase biotin carboxyl carrier protein [Kiritimatiellia bacterium]